MLHWKELQKLSFRCSYIMQYLSVNNLQKFMHQHYEHFFITIIVMKKETIFQMTFFSTVMQAVLIVLTTRTIIFQLVLYIPRLMCNTLFISISKINIFKLIFHNQKSQIHFPNKPLKIFLWQKGSPTLQFF